MRHFLKRVRKSRLPLQLCGDNDLVKMDLHIAQVNDIHLWNGTIAQAPRTVILPVIMPVEPPRAQLEYPMCQCTGDFTTFMIKLCVCGVHFSHQFTRESHDSSSKTKKRRRLCLRRKIYTIPDCHHRVKVLGARHVTKLKFIMILAPFLKLESL